MPIGTNDSMLQICSVSVYYKDECFRITKENNQVPEQMTILKKSLILSTHDSNPWQNRILSSGILTLSRFFGEIKRLLSTRSGNT